MTYRARGIGKATLNKTPSAKYPSASKRKTSLVQGVEVLELAPIDDEVIDEQYQKGRHPGEQQCSIGSIQGCLRGDIALLERKRE